MVPREHELPLSLLGARICAQRASPDNHERQAWMLAYLAMRKPRLREVKSPA